MDSQCFIVFEVDAFSALLQAGDFWAGVAYLRTFGDTCNDLLRDSGLYLPTIKPEVSLTTNAADIDWFKTHADRTHRLREAGTGELVLNGETAVSGVIVQQIQPGLRLLTAIGQGLTQPCVRPASFMDSGDRSYIDRDLFLNALFRELCMYPGFVLDVSGLIQNVKQIEWCAKAAQTPSTHEAMQ